jgi:hypothetical protein
VVRAKWFWICAIAVAVIAAPAALRAQTPVGTAFTYQGQLRQAGEPFDGTADFEFTLWDAAVGGTQLAGPEFESGVEVVNGLFTVTTLDFGEGVFAGAARWLEIAVNGTTLSPRQELTPAPCALALPGLWTEQDITSPNVIGGYTGNAVDSYAHGATIGGGGAVSLLNRVYDHWATVAGGLGNSAGSDDGNPASAQHAAVAGGRINVAGALDATVGGGRQNTASGNEATVAGGRQNTASGNDATVAGGAGNHASQTYAFVGGGWANNASSTYTVVGGGNENTASGVTATIGGGYSNEASGIYATVGGGYDNTASNERAVVGGGWVNSASGAVSTVGGGQNNDANGPAATIGGGAANSAGPQATVGGGNGNIASGQYATVPGGAGNTAAGVASFAAGRLAKANHHHTFVWNDSTNEDFASTANDQFLIRASGGVGIGTANPQAELDVAGDMHVSGTVTKSYTAGTRDRAIPIAYAAIRPDGSMASGTPNISSTYDSSDSRYEITITGEDYSVWNYVTVVTPASTSPTFASCGSLGGQLTVYIKDISGNNVQRPFHFVTYKPGAPGVSALHSPWEPPIAEDSHITGADVLDDVSELPAPTPGQ